jgi:hypothetical protein
MDVGHELTHPLVHDLVSKLAVIVGHCKQLSDHLKTGSQSAQRVSSIQEIAEGVANEFNKFQCRRAEWPRSADVKRRGIA